ncbi:MAG: hypothetical protein CMQ34_06445 [Gammaproteobacteria bacterium]|nr:hypothetical protein [Gammaproteobacteria bacterium]|tara:strand:- start:282 stop:557 length:276 start_codon:yes stop_codon:yes gene_type:complete
MIKKMRSSLKLTAVALAGTLLAACSSTNDHYTAPSYATMYNGDTYRVICTGIENQEVYVRYNALDTFYRPDETLKTRDEFCRENTVGASAR